MGLFGFGKKKKTEEVEEKVEEKVEEVVEEIGPMLAYENGLVVPMNEVDDPTFAQEILGPGVAIEPEDGALYSPCVGTVSLVADTKHAVSVSAKNGAEILMHIGIDTVELKGEGFEVHVNVGDEVKPGDKLISFDMDLIKGKGFKLTTPIIVCNHDEFETVKPLAKGEVKVGDELLIVSR